MNKFDHKFKMALDPSISYHSRIRVHGPGEIVVACDGVPIWVGSQNIRQNLQYRGDALEIIGQKGQTYGYSIEDYERQDGEPHDDEAPYQKPPAKNFLAKLRERHAMGLMGHRESFLLGEGEALSPYEVEDDQDDPLFEEEVLEVASRIREEQPAVEPDQPGEPQPQPTTPVQENAE